MTDHHVFSVHTSGPDNVGAVEIIFRTEGEARAFALDRSRDYRVLSASVTRFIVGQLGSRHPVAWYADGVEQARRWDRRLYPTDGQTAADDASRGCSSSGGR